MCFWRLLAWQVCLAACMIMLAVVGIDEIRDPQILANDLLVQKVFA